MHLLHSNCNAIEALLDNTENLYTLFNLQDVYPDVLHIVFAHLYERWGRYLVSGDSSGRLLAYNASTFEKVLDMDTESGSCVSNVCFHPYAAVLVGCTGDRRIPKPVVGRAHRSEPKTLRESTEETEVSDSDSDSDSGSDSDSDSGDTEQGVSLHLWGLGHTPLEYSPEDPASASVSVSVSAPSSAAFHGEGTPLASEAPSVSMEE